MTIYGKGAIVDGGWSGVGANLHFTPGHCLYRWCIFAESVHEGTSAERQRRGVPGAHPSGCVQATAERTGETRQDGATGSAGGQNSSVKSV